MKIKEMNYQVRGMIIGLVTLLSSTPAAQAAIFDAAADFSASDNPNSVWSYGWSETLGSAFHLYTDKGKDSFGNDVWYDSPHAQFVVHNGTGTVTSIWQVDQLGFGPGQNNTYSVIRWTAPSTEIYTITASFGAADNTTSDAHLQSNGNSLFQGDINGFGSAVQFSPTTIAINAGDTIDFTVGWGANGNINSDNTSLSATISTVPIPATIWLFGSALLGLFGASRKRAVL